MIPSLRVSVWPSCDLACRYCHKEGNPHPGRHLQDREILEIIQAALPVGVVKIKITGGEPLLRPYLSDLMAQIIRWGVSLTLTTNGTRLSLWAAKLREIGLKRVGVSLDTLDLERFRQLCGVDNLASVIDGIHAARNARLPIELNTVLMRGVNEDEWENLTDFAKTIAARLQLIELSPAAQSPEFYECHHVNLDYVEQVLQEQGETLESVQDPSDRPRYRFHGVEVSLCRVVDMNQTMSKRRQGLRLSADGKVYSFDYRQPCLADLAQAYRQGTRGKDLTRLWIHVGTMINQNVPH